VIDLKVHKAFWEDIQDVLVSKARRHENGVSLDKVKAGLIASATAVRFTTGERGSRLRANAHSCDETA
jgi:predicted metal-dependent phosphotriesterase family hydrolase